MVQVHEIIYVQSYFLFHVKYLPNLAEEFSNQFKGICHEAFPTTFLTWS